MSRHIVIPGERLTDSAKDNSKTVWQAGSRLLLSLEKGRAMLSKACNVSYATLFIACAALNVAPFKNRNRFFKTHIL